ncbi:MAG: outer membrane beta-barrel protein [Candidatus Saccharibacteria bacterium]
MNDKNIDELFRDKLKDLEKTPPAYLFDNVMAGVSAMRRKRRLMYWRIGSVAAALLLAFVAGWQISQYNSRTEKQVAVLHDNKTEQSLQKENNVQKTETLSANHTQAGSSENKTPATGTDNNNNQLAYQAKASAKVKPTQQEMVSHADKAEIIDPLKTIEAKLKSSSQFANIPGQKIEKTEDDQAVTSMDRQIMEQNLQALQSQEDNQRKNRWMVGAQVSPAVNVTRSSHSSQYANSMLNASSSPVDLGAGLSVEYKPSKRWSVQSGVYYAGIAQTSVNITSSRYEDAYSGNIGMDYFNAPVNIVSDKMMMNSTAGVIEVKNIPSGMIVGTNLEDKSLSTAVVVSDAKFIQNFEYLEIPLYLRYSLIDARFDVQLMGGVSSNVLVGNNTYLDSNSGKTQVGKTRDMQNMSYSSTLGLGVKYGLSKRVFLNVEPRVKYYLNSLNNNPSVNYKPYTIGVFTGISYSF